MEIYLGVKLLYQKIKNVHLFENKTVVEEIHILSAIMQMIIDGCSLIYVFDFV